MVISRLHQSLFDRVRPNIVLDYSDIDEARSIMTNLDLNDALTDIQTAAVARAQAGKSPRSAIAGVARWLIWQPVVLASMRRFHITGA